MTLATTAALATAQLVVLSAKAAARADIQTTTALLAAGRIEQLQALPWWFVEGAGGALESHSDTSTDLACDPLCGGGRGLAESPSDALLATAPGYADYVGRDGRSLGLAPVVPAEARYLRRWSVSAAPSDPLHTLVLGVRVTPVDADMAVGTGDRLTLLAGETWLVTLRARTRP